MDSLRLERVLVGVARKYAPLLVPAAWERAGDYLRLTGKSHADLARGLAHNGALVMFGTVPPHLAAGSALYLQDWADHWVRLHAIFVDALFPSYKLVSAYFLDQDLPRTIMIYAQAAPVSAAIALIAVPFIAYMEARTPPDESALAETAAALLVKMEAENIPRPLRDSLTSQAVVHLRLLIKSQVLTVSPIPYVPGETLGERLPDMDDTTPIAVYDYETSSLMAVTRQLDTPLPETLPEMRNMTAASAPKPKGTGSLPAIPIPEMKKQTGTLPPPPPIPELPKRKS